MKLFSSVLALTLVTLAPIAHAIPMLSSDGRVLSGVEYNGGLYDVNFVDGVFEDYFPVAQVSSPNWFGQAQAMSNALFDALLSMTNKPTADQFNGCESTFYCGFAIPETYIAPSTYRQLRPVVQDSSIPGTVTTRRFLNINADMTEDTGEPGRFESSFITLALLTEATNAIPIPSSLVLALSAIVLLLQRRRSS
ncbi:Uncharacterised protein [Halioglobus japonicus]|nr:Uncharacterised protein [Halioglobus japonicus]